MTRPSVDACVALGANLGDALGQLQAAVVGLAALPDTTLLACSALYRSASVGAPGPDYLNAVVRLRTGLTAPGLLVELQRLETEAGRTRSFANAPRTLDLDLLLYGQARIDSPRLTVPHPRMGARAFVVWPLRDVWPEAVDAAQLAAVADQAIERLERDWAAGRSSV